MHFDLYSTVINSNIDLLICIIILYLLYTDLERQLSVRTNRDELIKKGILPVTTEGE